MKYVLSLVLVILNILNLIGQNDFRQGYLIMNDNDTIHGFIDYKGNKASAKICKFKININGDNETFNPNEIKGYRFTNGKFYVSRYVTHDNETEQLFLEYLIDGIVDIYYYRSGKGEHYFIDNGTGILHELINEEKEYLVNGVRYKKQNHAYIGLLKISFQESPEITKKSENIRLNHKSLIGISHDFHADVCSDEECIIFEKSLPKTSRTYGLIIGLNTMLISETKGVEIYYFGGRPFKATIHPSLGVFYKVNLPYLNERLYFKNELTYAHRKYSTSTSTFENGTNFTYINDITMSQDVVSNLLVMQYEFPKGVIRPTFQYGGFVKYAISTRYERNLEVLYLLGNTNYTRKFDNAPFGSWDYGLNLGIGFKTQTARNKDINFDFRYQKGWGLGQQFDSDSYQINLSFQL